MEDMYFFALEHSLQNKINEHGSKFLIYMVENCIHLEQKENEREKVDLIRMRKRQYFCIFAPNEFDRDYWSTINWIIIELQLLPRAL